MIRHEHDESTITEKAETACREVTRFVIERAKQTHTPIIVFTDNRIQTLHPQEFEKIATGTDYEPAQKK